jgi:CheY-like chemotaxis protein
MDTARVLVVDDDEATRCALHVLLEEAGYSVEECADGRECLDRLFGSVTPLVVLLDYRMPGTLSGMAVLEAVEQDRRLAARHTYVAMTASPERLPTREAEVRSALHVPLVAKPFDIDDMLETVAAASQYLTRSLQHSST